MTKEEIIEKYFFKPSFFRRIRKCVYSGWRIHPKFGLQEYTWNWIGCYWTMATWNEFNQSMIETERKNKASDIKNSYDNDVSNFNWESKSEKLEKIKKL